MIAGVSLYVLLSLHPGGSLEDGATPPRAGSDEFSARWARLVENGLQYLARHQNEDGSFSAEPDEEVTRAPLAVTALASLAFMASGSTMGRGRYQPQVRNSMRYLLDHAREKPPPDFDTTAGDAMPLYFTAESDATSKMHGHGYATLAVAEAYGTIALDPTYLGIAGEKARADLREMRRVLNGAVQLIQRSQAKVGGWYYEPYDWADHEGSVTITMIQALRASRNVGIKVNKQVIDDAVAYIHNSQSIDGGFKYHMNSQTVTYALTAAAIATLNATGDYDSDVIDRGIAYMQRHDPLFHSDRWAENNNFPYYARLYAAQAYYMYRDPKLWTRWQELILDDLENRQDRVSGAFRNEEYGKVYATVMSCLMLQLPYQYLPIFQK